MNKKVSHIAYVDDDPDDHYLFNETVGHTFPNIRITDFYQCSDMFKALNELGKEQLPELIFLDLNMPGNEGGKCLKELKENSHLNHIPVIIYSTSSAIFFKQEMLNKGAFKYIVKPPSIEDLKQIIKETFFEIESNLN